MTYTEEDLILAYLKSKNMAETARILGKFQDVKKKILRQDVERDIKKLRSHGVNIPRFAKRGTPLYSPERIKELNDLISNYETHLK